MHDTDLFRVWATDGEAKRWQWDSRWFDLPAGGEPLIFPAGPAQQAVRYFTTRDGFGEPVTTVEIEPYSGQVTLQAVRGREPFRDEDGAEYETLAELIEAVKARTIAAAESGEPGDSDNLEQLGFPDLKVMAEKRGIPVPVGTSKADLVTALSGG